MPQTVNEMKTDRIKQYISKSIESVNPDKNKIISHVERNKDKAIEHENNPADQTPPDKLDYHDGSI